MNNYQGALANGIEYQSIIDSIVKNDDHKTSFYKIFMDMIWSQEPDKVDLLALAKIAMGEHAAIQDKQFPTDHSAEQSNVILSNFIAEIWSVESKSVDKLDFDMAQAANGNEEKVLGDAKDANSTSTETTDQLSLASNASLDAFATQARDPLSFDPSELSEDDVYGPSFAVPLEENHDDLQDDAGEIAPAPVYNMQDIMMMIFNDKNQREQAELNSEYDDYAYMHEAA